MVVLRQEIMRSVIDAFDQASIRVEFIGVDSQLLQHENMIRLLVEEDMVHVISPMASEWRWPLIWQSN